MGDRFQEQMAVPAAGISRQAPSSSPGSLPSHYMYVQQQQLAAAQGSTGASPAGSVGAYPPQMHQVHRNFMMQNQSSVPVAAGYPQGSVAYSPNYLQFGSQQLPQGGMYLGQQGSSMLVARPQSTDYSAVGRPMQIVSPSPSPVESIITSLALNRERARYVAASKQANAASLANRDRHDEVDERRMRAFSRLKGHTFSLGNRAGKWTLPLGLTTLRKHSTSVRTDFFRKAKGLRDTRAMSGNLARKIGYQQYSPRILASPTADGDLQVGPSEFGPLPGQILVHAVDSKASNWLGINTDTMTDPGSAKKAKVKSPPRQRVTAAAPPQPISQSAGHQKSAVTPPLRGASRKAAAVASPEPVVTSSGRRVKKKSLALEFSEAAPKKSSRNTTTKRAVKKAAPPPDDETDDDELPYDDMDEEVGDSQSDNDHSDDDDDDDRWTMPKYKPKKAFPTACVLVSVSDPDNIRVFTTASKAQTYLKLRNKSIYYQARRNETSLKGWFIFDGSDYSRKTGREITEALIEETEEKARSERAEADAARKERSAGKKKVSEAPAMPVRTSGRKTAGTRKKSVYGEEDEVVKPATGKGRRKAAKEEQYDNTLAEPTTPNSGRSTSASKRPSSADARPGSAGRGPPPRCDCGRYFSSQDLVAACRETHARSGKKKRSKSANAVSNSTPSPSSVTALVSAAGFASNIPEVEACEAKPQIGFMTSEVGLRQPSLPVAFNIPGVKPKSLFVKTFKSVARDDERTYADSLSPTGVRQRPTLQALLGSVDPPDCPESVLSMDEYPLVRIGDTFEMGIKLSKEVTGKANIWQTLQPHEHSAFGLCSDSIKIEFESYYYDYCSGIVCLRCQNAPNVCTCTFPNDLITVSTRVPMAHAPEPAGAAAIGSDYIKICCKIPRSRSRGRSNSWNSNLRTITGKAPKVMLIRAIESHATPSGDWEVVSVQQAYCRLIAKNGALDLAYAGGAPRRRSLSASPADDTPRKRKESNRSPSPLWEQEDEPDVFGDERVTPSKRRRAAAASPVTPGSAKRSLLPSSAVAVLKQWLSKHTDNPYPTEFQKKSLGQQLGLTHAQVSYWFINARRRLLGPMLRDEAKRKDAGTKQ